MARHKRSKTNKKYFEDIDKINTDKSKDREKLAKIVKCKSEYNAANDLRLHHFKQYKYYKQMTEKAQERLLNAIPGVVK